ncbi:hypothetical protein GN958_ATG18280 [Phytophthora infestans]|uniref:RxLR effector protein n=1 Tax=Phytophthora infestans TaxID=4787 RepID=A0A8S9TVT6_PHYIN|nr:hypothetical protein GN958_ATG18280 [Phytophthora infestans]
MRVLAPAPRGQQNQDLSLRYLRARPTEDGNAGDGDNQEERGFKELGDWVKYKAGKMNPKELYKYLGLEGHGQEAYKKEKEMKKFLKKAAIWRDKH